MDAKLPDHVKRFESGMKSFQTEELFDIEGKRKPEVAALAAKGARRMGANPHANGGDLLRDLRKPNFRDHAVKSASPGAVEAEDTQVLGAFLREVTRANMDQCNFRIFGRDETLSDTFGDVFEATNPRWNAVEIEGDECLGPSGRAVDWQLSERQRQGWLESDLPTGRHGLFNSYEAFIRIVSSLFSQLAKWLKVTLELPW